MPISNVINFDNPLNFSYDPALIEFASGKARLKDLRPANAIFHNNFSQVIGNWATVDKSFEVFNAQVINGKFVGNANAQAYGQTAVGAVSPCGTKGAIRLNFIPTFTGNPTSPIYYFRFTELSTLNNRIELFQDTSGNFRVMFYNSVGVRVISSQAVGNFQFTNGEASEIELNFDTTAGYAVLSVRGVAGSTFNFTPFTRTDAATKFLIGSNASVSVLPLTLDAVTVFSTVQHTANYTPGDAITPTVYSTAAPSIAPSASIFSDAILSSEVVGSSGVLIAPLVNNVRKYFNNSWINSDGSPLEMNDAAIYSNNISSLDLAGGFAVTFFVRLLSNGEAREEIESIATNYDFAFQEDAPTSCIVYGAILDICGQAVAGARITFSSDPFYYGNNLISISCQALTDSQGEFELSIVETESVSKTAKYLVEVPDGRKWKTIKEKSGVIIPNAPAAKISDL